MDPVLIQYHAVGSEEWVWHPGRRVFVQQLVAVVLACTFHGIGESLLAGQCWLCSICLVHQPGYWKWQLRVTQSSAAKGWSERRHVREDWMMPLPYLEFSSSYLHILLAFPAVCWLYLSPWLSARWDRTLSCLSRGPSPEYRRRSIHDVSCFERCGNSCAGKYWAAR